MRVVRLVIAAVVLAVIGSGCGVFGDDGESSGSGALDGLWVAVEIDGQPIVIDDNTEQVPSSEVTGGELAGSFGCGDGDASFTIGEVSLTVETVGVPDDGCESVAVSFAENAVLDVLAAEEVGYTIDDGRMVWVAAGRQIVFESASEPPTS